jgi:ABC-type transporter Mla subunit MlaD
VTSPRRRRKERRPRKRIVLGLLLVLVFAVGIALGEALRDNPKPGKTVTQDRTFTLTPESATVTVTTP